jgi:hypothetical protein
MNPYANSPDHLTSDQLEAEILRLFAKLEEPRKADLLDRLHAILAEELDEQNQPLTEL